MEKRHVIYQKFPKFCQEKEQHLHYSAFKYSLLVRRATAEGTVILFSKLYGSLCCFKTWWNWPWPGAKINSAYYCDHVFEQVLLPDIHLFSNDDFCVNKTDPGTAFTTHCGLPEIPCARVHFTRKVASQYSGSKSCGLFSVSSIAKDSASQQNFRH